jgi:hypothetical protein
MFLSHFFHSRIHFFARDLAVLIGIYFIEMLGNHRYILCLFVAKRAVMAGIGFFKALVYGFFHHLVVPRLHFIEGKFAIAVAVGIQFLEMLFFLLLALVAAGHMLAGHRSIVPYLFHMGQRDI